jgi:cytochrome bd-type quinol oxidase subunit 2
VTPSPNPKSEHDFLRLLQYAGAGCLGLTAAFVQAIKSVNPTLQIEFSLVTLLVGAAVTGGAWYVAERVFFRALAEGRPPPVKLAVGFTLVLTLGTLAGFALATRGVSNERQHDMAVGTALAVLALSIVGVAFWKVVRFLERDAAKTDLPTAPPTNPDEPPSFSN